MANTQKDYAKPYRTIPELLDLLASRGLEIDDALKSEQFLSSVNYYRFSGYVIQFLENGSREKYLSGSCFSDIIAIYKLDQQLRDIFFEALEAVELTFRTQFAREFSRCYSSLAYLDIAHYENPGMFYDSMQRATKEINVTQNKFICHMRNSYKQIPLWAIVEIMSFGWVIKLFLNLKREERRVIAEAYDIRCDILHSYMKHALVLRNICAHHARLFDNRTYAFKPLKEWRGFEPFNTNRIFYQAVLLYRLMRPTAQIVFDREDWKRRICALFDSLPEKFGCFDYRKYASIPEGCKESPYWIG